MRWLSQKHLLHLGVIPEPLAVAILVQGEPEVRGGGTVQSQASSRKKLICLPTLLSPSPSSTLIPNSSQSQEKIRIPRLKNSILLWVQLLDFLTKCLHNGCATSSLSSSNHHQSLLLPRVLEDTRWGGKGVGASYPNIWPPRLAWRWYLSGLPDKTWLSPPQFPDFPRQVLIGGIYLEPSVPVTSCSFKKLLLTGMQIRWLDLGKPPWPMGRKQHKRRLSNKIMGAWAPDDCRATTAALGYCFRLSSCLSCLHWGAHIKRQSSS